MLKTKIKGIPFKFSGAIIQRGDSLIFKAENVDNTNFSITDVKGIKVISLFPDISTKICDIQTLKIVELAKKHENIAFISISTDTPAFQKAWCARNEADNITIISDRKFKEFQTQTNIYLPKIRKLGRGLIVLDENNTVIDITVNKELSVEPDWTILDNYL